MKKLTVIFLLSFAFSVQAKVSPTLNPGTVLMLRYDDPRVVEVMRFEKLSLVQCFVESGRIIRFQIESTFFKGLASATFYCGKKSLIVRKIP